MTADLLVLGLGPAGTAAALRAARVGASVILAGEPARAGLAGEHLAPEGVEILRRLGLDPPPPLSHRCPGVRLAWGGETHEIDHLYHAHGAGCVVERPAFEQWLLARARDCGVRVIDDFRLRQLQRSQNVWRAGGERRQLAAHSLTDATGRAAAAARRLGARRYRCDSLVALGARLDLPGDDRFLTVVSSPDGWWYTLALPNGQRTIVYLTDSDLIGEMRDPAAWWKSARNTSVLADLIRDGSAPGNLLMAPAHTAFLEPSQGPDWQAVGDAAASLDPLSSRGLTHALTGQGEVDPQSFFRAWWQAYAGETRWPDRPFWRRRAWPTETELPRLPQRI